MAALNPDHRAILDRPASVIAALARTVVRRPTGTAYRHRADGAWPTRTWGEIADLVCAGSAELEARGLTPGDAVLLESAGGLPELIAELSILACGATVSTVPADLGDEALAELDPRLILTADETAVLVETRPPPTGGSGVALAARASRCTADLPALRVVTGTAAGTPELTTVTHGQLTYQGAALTAMGVVTRADTVLVPAPLSDPIAHALLVAQVMTGAVAGVCGRGDPIAEAYQVIGPTVSGFSSTDGELIQRALLHHRVDDRPWSERPWETIAAGLSMMSGRASERVPELGVLRAFFGSRLENLVVDLHDTPLTLSMLKLLGLPVLRAGCSPLAGGLVSLDDPSDRHSRTAGRPLPLSSARVDEAGQLLLSGPGVPSEWTPTGLTGTISRSGRLVITPGSAAAPFARARPAAPSEPVPHARLRLVGQADRDAPYAAEAGRDAAGPQVLEAEVVPRRPRELLGRDVDAQQVFEDLDARFVRLCAPASRLFVGERSGVRVGLVCLDGEGLPRWARSFHVAGSDFAEIASSDDCHAFVQACVAALNGRLAPSERILDFAIIDHPLDDPAIRAEEFLGFYRVLVDQLIVGARPALTVVPEARNADPTAG